MTPAPNVLEALLDWFTEHHARGGGYSAAAVQAAGEAAVAAEAAGRSPDDCFQAGQQAYFEHLAGAEGPSKRRSSPDAAVVRRDPAAVL